MTNVDADSYFVDSIRAQRFSSFRVRLFALLGWAPAVAGLLFVILLFSTTVEAEDSCSDVLLQKLANQTSSVTTQAGSQAQHYASCAISDSANSGSRGAGGNLSVGSIVSVGGSSTGQTSQHSDTSNCGEGSEEAKSSAALYYATTVNTEVVEKWKECMVDRHQLTCWATGSADHSQVGIHIQSNLQGDAPKVTSAAVNIGEKTSELVPMGSRLHAGDKVYSMTRAPTDNVHVSLIAVDRAHVDHSCEVWIPAEPPTVIASGSVHYAPIANAGASAILQNQNFKVSRTDQGVAYDLKVDFIVQPAPPPLKVFNVITIHGYQVPPGSAVQFLPNGAVAAASRQYLPVGTFPSITGSWNPGDHVSFDVIVPKQFADASLGWHLESCIGLSFICVGSPNLLAGSPLP